MSKLSKAQIGRYGRHLILDKMGVDVQSRICDSSVLVVGAGGLGSSLLLSLVGAGVGRIGIVDHDIVSESNLHRQTLYSEKDINQPKVKCAEKRLKEMNSLIKIKAIEQKFTCKNAKELVEKYDIVADCTDNMDARYIINDFTVAHGKPLVSAAAIGTEGQLSVYNFKNGPCLRCVFPEKSPEDTVGNCSDNGVLGTVPSIMGSMQALEILKIAGCFGSPLSSKILYFNALESSFKTVKIREKNCEICQGKVSLNKMEKMNEKSNCCGNSEAKQFNGCEITCSDLHEKNKNYKEKPFLLVDVRDETQFKICKLPSQNVLHIPLEQMSTAPHVALSKILAAAEENGVSKEQDGRIPVYVNCRRGISSKTGCQILSQFEELHPINVKGGIEGWAREVDKDFPVY